MDTNLDDFTFATEEEKESFPQERNTVSPWLLMVVDDEEDVHSMTRLVLKDFTFEDAPIAFLHAYSAEEAKDLLRKNPNVAMILLDVVMETENAGLELVRFIREELGNKLVRIVLRTGQPGQAPEREVVAKYDINDYKHKGELTFQRLFTTVMSSLRSFRDLQSLEKARQELQRARDELELRVEERTRELRREIEERKKMETQLIRSERLAAVGTLAGGIAHEFNNINTAVFGFAELALLNENLDAEVKDYLQRIMDGIWRAKKITQNLLAFARAGKKETFRPADLNTVIRETLPIIEGQLRAGGVELVLDLGEIPEIPMDPDLMGQVMLNLIINAHHAMLRSSEKRLTIRTARIGRSVVVQVSDTGCGIPEENMTKIFTPFFSTKGEHSTDFLQADVKGTGLGLSVSHTIVENHGGKILVESTVGKGTTFTIRLPLSQEGEFIASTDEKAETTSSPSSEMMRGGTIVILDDEKDILDLLLRTLRILGHSPFVFTDGKQALEKIRKERIDLVITDLVMPGMDGIQFLQELHTLPPERRPIPVVLTGKWSEEFRKFLENLEVFAILKKPYAMKEIHRCVMEALRQRRQQGS